MQVQVIGKPLRYGSRLHPINGFVDMTDKHARLFMAIGRVRLPEPPRADIPASPSLPVIETEAAMETENAPTEPAPAEQPTEPQPAENDGTENTPRPRRYRRRDMQPEG